MKKSKVLLIDAFSTAHVGNGALIDNTYKLCSKYISTDIEILSIDARTNNNRFPKVHDDIFTDYNGGNLSKLLFTAKLLSFYIIEAANEKVLRGKAKLPWRGKLKILRDTINDSDICISMSGETINDHYRPHLYLRLLTYHLAILKKKKFLIFPQSIGPIFRTPTKILLRIMLGKAFSIIARDISSFNLSKEIWKDLPVSIVFCPDVAITQESMPQKHPTILSRKKLIGLTVSEIPPKEMGFSGEYLKKIIGGITKTLEKDEFQFLLMPSNYRRNEESPDYTKCKEAKLELEKYGYEVSILKNDFMHPDEYQGIQKSLFIFISTRMHVGILATSAGTPTLMINTQHKILEYMKLIGMEKFTIELKEIDLISAKLKTLKEENQKIRSHLLERNLHLRDQIESTIENLGNQLMRNI